MARWKSPISVLGCSNSEFDVTRYLRNIWCFVMSVKTSVIFPSDCWWRNWWISWKEFPKPSLPPAGRTKKFRGNKRKGKKVMQIQKRVCTWLWKNVEKSNRKITVMISDSFLDHWKTSSMCGRGSDATACTRSTQPSAKCSLWVIHRKWWEPLHFPDWMHSYIPVLCQVWLDTTDLLLMLSFCLRIPTVFFLFQELFGAVQVSPLSSGYSLGSSNWIIQSHHEKVSYVSGSSLLTTHPQVSQQAQC